MIISEVLSAIDIIDSTIMETEANVCLAIADSYDKMLMIEEHYNGEDMNEFTIFQEGKIMDDVKEQGKGQSTFMKILSFIPRLFISLFRALTGKLGSIASNNIPAIQKKKDRINKKTNKNTRKKFFAAIGIGGAAVAGTVGTIAAVKHKKKSDTESNESENNTQPHEDANTSTQTTDVESPKSQNNSQDNKDVNIETVPEVAKLTEEIKKCDSELVKLESESKKAVEDVAKTTKNPKIKDLEFIKAGENANIFKYDSEHDELLLSYPFRSLAELVYSNKTLLMSVNSIIQNLINKSGVKGNELYFDMDYSINSSIKDIMKNDNHYNKLCSPQELKKYIEQFVQDIQNDKKDGITYGNLLKRNKELMSEFNSKVDLDELEKKKSIVMTYLNQCHSTIKTTNEVINKHIYFLNNVLDIYNKIYDTMDQTIKMGKLPTTIASHSAFGPIERWCKLILKEMVSIKQIIDDLPGNSYSEFYDKVQAIMSNKNDNDDEDRIEKIHEAVKKHIYSQDTSVKSNDWKKIEDFLEHIKYKKVKCNPGDNVSKFSKYFENLIPSSDDGPVNTLKTISQYPFILDVDSIGLKGDFDEIKLCGKAIYYSNKPKPRKIGL